MKDNNGEIFQNIHEIALKNETFRSRSMKRYSLDELGFSSIENNVCCVFGCGAGGTEILNLLNLGAKFVHGIDLIPEYVPTTENELKGFENKYKLTVGSIVTNPYEDEMFDFVTCNGVIHHIDKDFEALQQISRTVKKGGHAYLEVAGKGGIIDEFVKGTLRNSYAKDDSFKEIIDNLSLEKIQKGIAWIKQEIRDDKTESYKQSINILDNISDLIDIDFVQCVLDRMQAPLYKGYTQKEFESMLTEAGFTSWRRISRKPNYNNIRKLATPFYALHDNLYSKLLYGDGQLSMMCKK